MIFGNYIKGIVQKEFNRLGIEFTSKLSKKDATILGIVTPEMFGNDLQKCLDSPRPTWLTESEYEISDTLRLNSEFKIVYGNLSTIKPIKNIPVFDLSKKEFKINDLILNTTAIEHSESGFLIDANNRIWGGKLINCHVLGKKETLYKTGMGTKALEFDTRMKVASPFITDIDIDLTVKWAAKGVYIPKQENDKLWINNCRFDTKMRGCKQFYHITEGDMYEIETTEAFEAVLNEEEKSLDGNCIHVDRTKMHIRPHDFRVKSKNEYHRNSTFLDRGDFKDLIITNTSYY